MQTLRNVIDLKADHISCYGLKVEPGTKLWSYKDCANLPDDDAQADMYFYAVETLEQFGYHQYEISNFAHDGFICRHNMKYWVGDEYLGFGPCAASDFAGRRFTIKPDLEGYIKGVMDKGQILSESELVPLRERAGEYLMLRLRTVDGIEKGEYTRSFLLPFEPIEEILLRLQTPGICRVHLRPLASDAEGLHALKHHSGGTSGGPAKIQAAGAEALTDEQSRGSVNASPALAGKTALPVNRCGRNGRLRRNRAAAFQTPPGSAGRGTPVLSAFCRSGEARRLTETRTCVWIIRRTKHFKSICQRSLWP